jgi:hypothetical protein
LDLEPGLYEELVTRRLRERIDELIAEGRRIREGRVDPAEESDVLARHVGRAVSRILTLVKPEQRVDAANHLLELAATLVPGGAGLLADVAPGPSRLEEILPISEIDGLRFVRPQIPLGRSDLQRAG